MTDKLQAAIDAALTRLREAIEAGEHGIAAIYADIVQQLHSIGGIKF